MALDKLDTRDRLRTIRRCGVTLTMWATPETDWRGQTRIAYRLRKAGRTLFEGKDFCGSPLHADDSDETVAALIGFLTLKKGDTDADFFANYTPEQIAWSESSECEQLALEGMRLSGELEGN